MEDNQASLRGGAVACEGCKSLNLSGPFGFVGNITTGADDPKGGAIYTDAPLVAKGVRGLRRLSLDVVALRRQPDGDSFAVHCRRRCDLRDRRRDDLEDASSITTALSAGALAVRSRSRFRQPEKATIKLTDSTFEDNSAAGRGGAVRPPWNRDEAQDDSRRDAGEREPGLWRRDLFRRPTPPSRNPSWMGTRLRRPPRHRRHWAAASTRPRATQPEANTLKIISSSVTNNQLDGGNNQWEPASTRVEWTSGF